MSAIPATFIDGKIVPDVPPEWPNGTRVWVELLECDEPDRLPHDDDLSPEAIARRLDLMEQIQPYLSSEEEAVWKKALAEQKAWQVANWDKHCRELEALFDDVVTVHGSEALVFKGLCHSEGRLGAEKRLRTL